MFSLLALFSALSWITRPFRWRRAGTVLAGLVLFAAATEVLQFISPGRMPGLDALFVDAAGMTVTVVLVCLWRLHSINRI
jgi:VanZ family protein